MATRVYIGRLARDARERDLERLFKGYGDIREINIKNGYGFVEFKDPRDAEDVVYDFHGKDFLGERIIVEIARGTRRGREERRRRDDRRSYRLFVEDIPSGTSWQDLKDLMRKAGEVTFADIIRSRPGEGVVEFAHRSDMEYALRKLDDADLNGQRIRLFEDRRSSRRSRSRSASRSRSPRHRSSRRSRYSRSRSPVSRSRSRTPSRSRSPSPRRSSRHRSNRRRDDEDVRSRSRTPEDDDRREDRSPAPADRSRSRTPSRSPSRSPEEPRD